MPGARCPVPPDFSGSLWAQAVVCQLGHYWRPCRIVCRAERCRGQGNEGEAPYVWARAPGVTHFLEA
jgi:hypothetical protein